MRSISPLIERTCATVSVLENTRQVRKWMHVQDFFAVMNEELQTTGIVTVTDVMRQNGQQLIDLDLRKPIVHPGESVRSVTHKMLEAGQCYLPVFDEDRFVGVISLTNLARFMLKENKL